MVSEQVFVMAASNLPWDLDVAVLRRLEKRVLVLLTLFIPTFEWMNSQLSTMTYILITFTIYLYSLSSSVNFFIDITILIMTYSH